MVDADEIMVVAKGLTNGETKQKLIAGIPDTVNLEVQTKNTAITQTVESAKRLAVASKKERENNDNVINQ